MTTSVVSIPVFAGVPRNNLSFQEIIDIFNGKTIIKYISSRFYRSISNLSITIKDTKIAVSFKPNKILVNNNYIPININQSTNPIQNSKQSLINRLKSMYVKFIK